MLHWQNLTAYAVYLQVSGQDILRHCSHAYFKDKLWPATQKALLRNPEIILEGRFFILSATSSYQFKSAKSLKTARNFFLIHEMLLYHLKFLLTFFSLVD